MMKISFTSLLFAIICASGDSFVAKTVHPRTGVTSLAASNYLEKGDPVLLVGPGFLQLVLAKHMKAAGLKPVVVAPQKKLDSFFATICVDDNLKADSTIGMPETGDPYFGELKGVVFCAEDAILPSDFVSRVLDFQHEGKSCFENGAPSRVVCGLPVDNKVQEEKSNSWIPIFNNDRTIAQNWKNFYEKFTNHAVYKSEGGVGSIVRFGSLFGGSFDGPEFLRDQDLALEEGMYKVSKQQLVLYQHHPCFFMVSNTFLCQMSLEQYRDLRERSFDRYKLAPQVLEGNSINKRPPNQEKMEKEALKSYKGEIQEAFSILGGYPEQDRSCRHTVAAAITQAMMMPVEETPKEMTILSKAESVLPTPDEWKKLFASPGGAAWPDPFTWRPETYGLEVE